MVAIISIHIYVDNYQTVHHHLCNRRKMPCFLYKMYKDDTG